VTQRPATTHGWAMAPCGHVRRTFPHPACQLEPCRPPPPGARCHPPAGPGGRRAGIALRGDGCRPSPRSHSRPAPVGDPAGSNCAAHCCGCGRRVVPRMAPHRQSVTQAKKPSSAFTCSPCSYVTRKCCGPCCGIRLSVRWRACLRLESRPRLHPKPSPAVWFKWAGNWAWC